MVLPNGISLIFSIWLVVLFLAFKMIWPLLKEAWFSSINSKRLVSIGDDNQKIFSSKLYSQIGVGVIISNDYLVFKSFQLSFSYYPNLPLDGGSLFKTNAIRTNDFGLENFGISKPELVKYQ